MQLKTKLTELVKAGNNKIVSIGSQSGFFFIGYPQEFLEQEEEYNKRWELAFKQSVAAATTAYNNCVKSPPDPDREIKRKERDPKTNRMTDMVVPIEILEKEWKQKCDNLEIAMQRANMKVNKFKPFGKREVKECYPGLNDDKEVIIIKGYEVGRYWMKSEFDKDTRKDLCNGCIQKTHETKSGEIVGDVAKYDQEKADKTEETESV